MDQPSGVGRYTWVARSRLAEVRIAAVAVWPQLSPMLATVEVEQGARKDFGKVELASAVKSCSN